MGLGKIVFGLIRSVVTRMSATSIVQVARPQSSPSIEERDFHHHNAIIEGARQEEEERRRQEKEEYEEIQRQEEEDEEYREELARRTPPKPAKTWKSHRDFLEHGGSLVQQEDGGCAFGCGLPVPSDGGSVDMNDGRGPLASCVHGVEAVRIMARDWKGSELTRPRFYYSEKIRLSRVEEEAADRQRIIKQEEERAATREEHRRQETIEEKRLNQMEKTIVERCFEHHAIGTPKAGSCEMPGCGEKFALHRLYFAERVLWPDVGAQPVGRMHKLCARHGHEARDVQHQKQAGIFWIFRDEQFATGYFKNRPIRFETRPTNGNGHGNGHNGSSMPSYEQLARVERSKKGKPKTSVPEKKKGKFSGLLSTEWQSEAEVKRVNAIMEGAPTPPPTPKPNKKAKKGRKANGAQASA